MNSPLDTPNRIAFAGDWHANTSWARSAIREACDADADVILHTGDLGYNFPTWFVDKVTTELAGAGMHLLFVDGNHDDHHLLRALPVDAETGLRQLTSWMWYVPRGFRWTWDGIRFAGVGGAHSVDRGIRLREGHLWWPEETITDSEEADIVAGREVDVLLTHDAPAGVPIPGLDPDAWPAFEIAAADGHRRRLRRIVDELRPMWIWHGHYHRRYAADVDFGWGRLRVTGLDMDATRLDRNLHLVDLGQFDERKLPWNRPDPTSNRPRWR